MQHATRVGGNALQRAMSYATLLFKVTVTYYLLIKYIKKVTIEKWGATKVMSY